MTTVSENDSKSIETYTARKFNFATTSAPKFISASLAYIQTCEKTSLWEKYLTEMSYACLTVNARRLPLSSFTPRGVVKVGAGTGTFVRVLASGAGVPPGTRRAHGTALATWTLDVRVGAELQGSACFVSCGLLYCACIST